MAQKTSSAVIGGFVLISIALLISAVFLFAGGDLFKKSNFYILYFQEAVTGLKVGSPVKFKGVEVGAVKSVVLVSDPESVEISIPVTIEVDLAKFKLKGDGERQLASNIDKLINLGLRAQLQVESLVASQLFVQLDFLPEKPVRLSGTKSQYPEIPTIKSGWSEFLEMLKELPIKDTLENFQVITKDLRHILESGKIEKILTEVDTTIGSAGEVADNANTIVNDLKSEILSISEQIKAAIPIIVEDINRTADNFEEVSGQAKTLMKHADQELDPLFNSLERTLADARGALEEAELTITEIGQFVENSDTRTKLNRSLDQISEAARSMKNFLDYLERHPEALLQGKRNQ